MYKNQALTIAKRNKEDEFYTQLSDIEDELYHYKDHFKDAIILCNCDDPYESNFFKYFALNFDFFGLKELICTCYAGSPVLGKEFGDSKIPYKAIIRKVQDMDGDGSLTLEDIKRLFELPENEIMELDGDGSYDSEECEELLERADIVVTNPPFSLYRDYLKFLLDHNKKFILLGSDNHLTYKDIFNYIKDDKVWLGYNSGEMKFTVPDYFEPRKTRYWVDENGQKWRSFGNMTWLTNLDIPKRHERLLLTADYKEEEYPKYDNYDIIEVGRVVNIPDNYDGIMGVPITYLHIHNPDQFEIVGLANSARWIGCECLTIINGTKKYNRVLIKAR